MKLDGPIAALLCASVASSIVIPDIVPPRIDMLGTNGSKWATNQSEPTAKTFGTSHTSMAVSKRSLIHGSCSTGPYGPYYRHTLEVVLDYVSNISFVLSKAALPENTNEDDARIFERAFGTRGRRTRLLVSRRFVAISNEAQKRQEGMVLLRCDDPFKECARQPGAFLFARENLSQLNLVSYLSAS